MINDVNIIGEIITDKLKDFYIWMDANFKRIDKMENPAANLLYYLKMTAKQGWIPQRWVIEEIDEEKATVAK